MTSPAFKIFYDTEFIVHTTGFGIDPVSIGLVAETGAEYYGVFDDFDKSRADPWLDDNVFAKLPAREAWRPADQLCRQIGEWFAALRRETRTERLEFWAQTDTYDAFILCQLFGGLAALWDFLAALGFTDVKFRDTYELRRLVDVPLGQQPVASQHIAIDDAHWEKRHFDEMVSLIDPRLL